MYLHVDMPTTSTRAKLFRHGGSQAARLPREFRLPGTEAAISRTPTGGVLLEPLDADFEARRRRLASKSASRGSRRTPPVGVRDIAASVPGRRNSRGNLAA